MRVSEAVVQRRSIRGFLDRAVDVDLVQQLARMSSRAPSGGNLQPWHIHLVSGQKLSDFRQIMERRLSAQPAGEGTEYDIYPKEFQSPYRDRNFAVGEELYAALGITRDDKASRHAWFSQNFRFFGAPLALFCFVDRRHGPPQWSDLGMYLQTFMLLLCEHGLASCPQECWAMFHKTVADFLVTPADQMLFCGMAIGYEDPNAPANRLNSTRAPAAEYLTVHR